MKTRTAACSLAALLAMSAGVLLHATHAEGDAYASLPTSVSLTAVIRDMKSHTDNGHPDFEHWHGDTRVGMVEETLGSDMKPVLKSRFGSEIVTEFKDKDGRNINPALFDAAKGDTPGTLKACTDARIDSEESFKSWYRDTPGVNASKAITLTLNRKPGTDRYVFDSATDNPWVSKGGFFPIDGDLYGNFADWGKNYHFTTEVATQFTYEKGKGHMFTFTGDDDVWVFIGGRLVIDLGDLHPKREQTIDLDRLAWLESGQTYSLHIFHAERHTTESNFRMETTLQFLKVQIPQVTGLHD